MRSRSLALTVIVALIALLGLTACSSTTAVQRVDPAAFADVISEPGVVIIDVRTPAEFAAGHIDGAINLDVKGPDFATQVAGLDANATYAVYCQSGNRSQGAVAAMADAGLTDIYELQTGISGWQAAGRPIA